VLVLTRDTYACAETLGEVWKREAVERTIITVLDCPVCVRYSVARQKTTGRCADRTKGMAEPTFRTTT
jgi:hypothetical protein